MPGASRHRWGTDLDIYDTDLLPPDAQLQLTPEEYLPGCYFAALTRWLDRHLGEYGFYRPYARRDRGSVAVEPWDISYRPLAGSAWLAPWLSNIFQRYINNIDKE